MSPRRALVVAHDLLATAAAVVASFFIRFEAAGLVERGDKLLIFLPGFIVYAGIIYFLFHLYEVEVAVRVAAGPDEHHARGDGAGGVAAGARLHPGRAQRARAVLLRQDHHRPLLGAADGVPGRPPGSATATSATPAPGSRRAPPRPIRRSSSDAPPTPKCCCARSRAARSRRPGRSASSRRRRADQGQAIRGIPVLGDFELLEAAVNDLAAARHRHLARDLHAVGVRAGRQAGSDLDARAPSRPHGHAAAFARGGRRHAAACAGQCRGSAAAAERQDRLRAAGEFSATAAPSSSPAAAARSAPRSATARSHSAPRGC